LFLSAGGATFQASYAALPALKRKIERTQTARLEADALP